MADYPSDATTGGAPELEVAVRLDDRPGNPALTPDGRLIVGLHPLPYGEPSPYRVVEVLEDGGTARSRTRGGAPRPTRTG
jgi:hypothetical protein